MSVRIIAAVFDLEISASEKLVLIALADHARDDGSGAYPSISRLERKTSLSERGVRKIMRKLESRNLIVPTEHVKGGRGFATEYKITLEAGNGKSDSLFGPSQKGASGSELREKRGYHSDEKGANRPEPGAPQPKDKRHEAEEAAAARNLEAWKDIGAEMPIGNVNFQKTWLFFWRHRNGVPLSEAMERTIQRWQALERKVPPPFFEAKRRAEAREANAVKPSAPRTLGPADIRPRERQRAS